MYVHENFRRDEASGKPIVEISHSGLNTFNSCPKKWAWRKAVINRNSDRDGSDAADAGTALHEGVQNYFVTKDMHSAVEALALAHPIELRDPGRASAYSLEASVITLAYLVENGIMENYEIARFTVDGAEVPAVEVPALVIIETPHFCFHLRQFIDLVLYNPVSGRFFAVDIKTTTPQGMKFFEEKYLWDWQVTSYGIPLAGLLGVEDEFDVGIMGVIQSDREPKAMFPKWRRNKHDVDAYFHWLIEAVTRVQNMWLAGHFVRQPTACVGYGRLCPYHAACGIDDLKKMQMFVNPLGDPGVAPRAFEPIYTTRYEVE